MRFTIWYIFLSFIGKSQVHFFPFLSHRHTGIFSCIYNKLLYYHHHGDGNKRNDNIMNFCYIFISLHFIDAPAFGMYHISMYIDTGGTQFDREKKSCLQKLFVISSRYIYLHFCPGWLMSPAKKSSKSSDYKKLFSNSNNIRQTGRGKGSWILNGLVLVLAAEVLFIEKIGTCGKLNVVYYYIEHRGGWIYIYTTWKWRSCESWGPKACNFLLSDQLSVCEAMFVCQRQ